MINYYIEVKNFYSTLLINLLTPIIYEGVQSIYTDSLKISKDVNDVLKLFQNFLKKIPKWNTEMISKETNRIINNSKNIAQLHDLIKATIKSNLVILTYNPSKNSNNINEYSSYYKDIKIEDFIHKVYIECARELYNNPYLMYHQSPPVEMKRNQRDTLSIIKEAITNAIKKILPINLIIESYLKTNLETNVEDFEKNITESEKNNMNLLLKHESEIEQKGGNENLNKQILNIIKSNRSSSEKQKGGDDTHSSSKKKIPSRKNSSSSSKKRSSSSRKRSSSSKKHSSSSKKHSSSSKKRSSSSSKKHSISSKKHSSEKQQGGDIDSKIKDILKTQLGDNDLETSLSYRPEKNDRDYHEIFTNNKTLNNNGSVVNKQKFFKNYLKM